jgi:hypothetical protein
VIVAQLQRPSTRNCDTEDFAFVLQQIIHVKDINQIASRRQIALNSLCWKSVCVPPDTFNLLERGIAAETTDRPPTSIAFAVCISLAVALPFAARLM